LSRTRTNQRDKKEMNKPKLSKDSIYNLDAWKWNYEEVSKPKNKVVVSLRKRIKHAWEILLG
jgi:hypothetical protein